MAPTYLPADFPVRPFNQDDRKTLEKMTKSKFTDDDEGLVMTTREGELVGAVLTRPYASSDRIRRCSFFSCADETPKGSMKRLMKMLLEETRVPFMKLVHARERNAYMAQGFIQLPISGPQPKRICMIWVPPVTP